jgi:peroxiredoxin
MTAQQPSTITPGSTVPDFELADVRDGRRVRPADAAGKALLVAFFCNHCPFVRHILSAFVAFADEHRAKGLDVVVVSSNDVAVYPQDGPTQMAELAREAHFGFPYLYDESQQVARAFGAVCTPEFFLFDRQHRLAYHGRFDEARPRQPTPVTGEDLRAAVDAVLQGRPAPADQPPAVGCGIKWKAA